MHWNDFVNALSMVATVAFAVTAVVGVRSDRGVDLFSAIVLGLITAIGGGTIRDIIMDVPVFWSVELSYIWVSVGASIVALYGRRLFSDRKLYSLMLYLDGFGAAMFAILATSKAWQLDFALPAGPVILGVVTAIGGGLLRDVLAGRPNLLMTPEIYASPILGGCMAYAVILTYAPDYRLAGSIACILATFAVRAAAIHWKLTLPSFARIERKPGTG